MGKRDRRSGSRSRSPSSSSDASRSRSRTRSRDRSSRKRRHSSDRSRSRSRSRSSRHKRKKEKKVKKERRRSRSRDRKKRRRSRSPSSDSSPSPSRSRSPKRDVKHESTAADPLQRVKAEEKARLKASETPAERAARRAAKKALKASSSSSLVGAAAAGGVEEKPFIWKKSLEKKIAEGRDASIPTRAELAAKQVALQEEIAQIKARKIQRAEEKEQMDALREQMAREAEAENIEGWEEKEEDFHRKNAQLRTSIRIAEGREKLIDVLAKNRHLYNALRRGPTPASLEEHPEWLGACLDPNLPPEADLELTEASHLLSSGDVPWRDLEYLVSDIEGVIDLEQEDREYWTACLVLARASIAKQKAAVFAAGAQFQQRARYGASSITPAASAAEALKEEMALLLRGKTRTELTALERDIDSLLAGERPAALVHLEAMDQNYWEALKVEIASFKHVAFLREFHLDLLQRRLKDLQLYILRANDVARAKREEARALAIERGEAEPTEEEFPEPEGEEFEPTFVSHPDSSGFAPMEDEEVASFSPALIPIDEDELEKHSAAARAIAAIDPEADARALAAARRAVAKEKQREIEERAKLAAGSAVQVAATAGTAAAAAPAPVSASASDDSAFRRESARGLAGDEAPLNNDIAVPNQVYLWQDKYRPRKPRFFNRVKTGFEWNKYNSTHYDRENPPPKIVQGYKFNIFYPDLIDPTVAPRYRIDPDPEGNPDFCIIRFMAGPPYEDIAFKIVKKEWEYSFKRGFKCVFDKGVLMLFFNFRRFFYRR